ncbi:MAG TPA: hypothetical protein VMB49_02230 [Acidobacteriaceae bacterium]|nr:hypothetical protein [Acidobacteriaceae bacterium]
MRANRLMNYTSILQVLGESGCPFCRFMKDFQAGALQKTGTRRIEHLCNFHTWGLAAMQKAPLAAELFLNLLEKESRASPGSPCDICIMLWEEEDRRVREFIACLDQRLVVQWIGSQAVLCSIHGEKLKKCAPLLIASTIETIIERYRKQLADELAKLRDGNKSETANWGLLGHAAEFLASQRGLHN